MSSRILGADRGLEWHQAVAPVWEVGEIATHGLALSRLKHGFESHSGFESALCVSGGRSSRFPAPCSIQHIQPPQPTTAEGVAAITAANPFPFPTSDGFVRFEEAPCVLDDLVDVLLRILPGIDGHLGVRGEAGDFHGHLVRVRWHVIGRDQQRCPDGAYEIARHGEDEVGAVRVHAGEEVMDHVHGDVWALRAQRRPPALDVVLVISPSWSSV